MSKNTRMRFQQPACVMLWMLVCVGLRAFRSRPTRRRQRSDLVTLAHIKEQSRLSLGSHGRPRMTEELKEIGLKVGDRRVGRFLLIVASNDCQAVDAPERYICCQNTQTHPSRAFYEYLAGQRVTTGSNHTFNIAPNLLDRNCLS